MVYLLSSGLVFESSDTSLVVVVDQLYHVGHALHGQSTAGRGRVHLWNKAKQCDWVRPAAPNRSCWRVELVWDNVQLQWTLSELWVARGQLLMHTHTLEPHQREGWPQLSASLEQLDPSQHIEAQASTGHGHHQPPRVPQVADVLSAHQ